MRIESFWAKGFRSLRDVRLEGLGSFNVLYGPNGGGKSNILAAVQAWIQLIDVAVRTRGIIPLDAGLLPPGAAIDRMRGYYALQEAGAPLATHDFELNSPRRLITLGGVLRNVNAEITSLEIELQIDGAVLRSPTLHRAATVNGVPLEHDDQVSEAQRRALSALEKIEWRQQFSLVAADRMPRMEASGERPPAGTESLAWYFRRGRLKDALFAAQNATSAATVRALERFRRLMAGPPLHRRAFRAVEDPHTGIRDLREWLPPPLDEHDISLDLAGLGVAQMYWILGQAMLSGARAVCIEEPEAHLHAPTSGRALRQLLVRLVEDKHIDQLFIATHSNLFDLDPAGYFDVSLVNGETVVQRVEDLTRIDRDHLYEPGPAKHALARMLQYTPPEEVIFRRPDGSGISAKEMLDLLQADDDLAVRFLEDIHGAAVRMVKVNAKKTAAR